MGEFRDFVEIKMSLAAFHQADKFRRKDVDADSNDLLGEAQLFTPIGQNGADRIFQT